MSNTSNTNNISNMNDTDGVQLHKAASNAAAPVQITAAAQEYITQYLIENPGVMRLSIVTTGCSGLAYDVQVVEKGVSGDTPVVVAAGVRLFVAADALMYVHGMTIDYGKEKPSDLSKKLLFLNPNEKASCGCGESFTV